jgi:HlyD family secretion protein
MSQPVSRLQSTAVILGWLALVGIGATLTSCSTDQKAEAEAQRGQPESGSVAVDTAVVRTASLQQNLEYTGTTQPYRQVSLRSQVEGQLIDLSVDVGDRVTQGQRLGQLDDKVLSTAVVEAQAEVAAREAEVAQARTQVSNARTQVEDARLKLQQAEADLARFEQLFREGAIPEQQVQTYRTTAGTARQAVRSAQEEVRTQQQAVAANQRRVSAQQAIVAREQERQSFSSLVSPVNGYVLQRVIEPGNLAQAGSEILKLGDFSQVKVAVQVSELELGTIRAGQPVQVKLDAFANRQFAGRVTRVSPAADPASRLIPVEVTIPNLRGDISSGLLARVSFSGQSVQRIVVPQTALETNQDKRSRQQGADKPGGSSPAPSQTDGQNRSTATTKSGTLFVVDQAGDKASAIARQVALGNRLDGRVEITSGLKVGDRIVTRSSRALKNGDPIKPSILSDG